MSTTELIPLFPSATHPAIPIAARILSTLRNLTAPGKGNDVKSEERAALVGVAAVLGCEKIQSKDLPESSAQKASSVSPAHFRSALARARKLLESTSTSTSTSAASPGGGGSRSSRSTRSSPRSATATTENRAAAAAASAPEVDPLSPFSTPRKRFKYSSGIDVSDLLRSGASSKHTPTHASPLRNSTTAREGEGERTPTKRTKFRDPHVQGVDLANVDPDDQSVAEPGPSRPRGRKRDDLSAFMALRPGSSPSTTPTRADEDISRDKGDELPEEEQAYLRSIRQKRHVNGHRRARKVQPKRRDWTCRETRWGVSEGVGRAALDQVLERLPAWLDEYGRPPLARPETAAGQETIVDVLLGAAT